MIGAVWAGVARVVAPGLRVMLRRRARRGKEIAARLPERFGDDGTARPGGRLVWIHSASMGESRSVLPVVELLVAGATVLMTTGTVTSASFLGERLEAFGGRAIHRFVPLDVPGWVGRFLDHWRPDAAVFVESELWPNLLAGCRATGVPAMLVNGRMSARSFSNWRLVPRFAREVVGTFDVVHAQSEGDAGRLLALGARAAALVGNLKLAAGPLPADERELTRLQGLIGARPVWLAASTHAGEEEVALAVHRALEGRHPGLLTIVAPRHADRGAALAAACSAPRRGAGQGPPEGGVWIADTMGELGLLYRLAPVVFMGRSLVVGGGGQNPLEPARLGAAVAMGPHVANFSDVVHRLREGGGLTVVPDGAALAAWVDAMLSNGPRRVAAGAAAVVAAEAGLAGGLPAKLARTILGLADGPAGLGREQSALAERRGWSGKARP